MKSIIIIWLPLYSKFKVNAMSLTEFYLISLIQSAEDGNFSFIPEKSSTQQSLKFKRWSKRDLTDIYAAGVSSLFTAKMKMPHWTVAGNCVICTCLGFKRRAPLVTFTVAVTTAPNPQYILLNVFKAELWNNEFHTFCKSNCKQILRRLHCDSFLNYL